MKQLAFYAALVVSPFSVQAAQEIVYDKGVFTLIEFSDEFTEEVTSCQLNIGEFANDKPRMHLFSKPTKDVDVISIATHAGRFDGSGYQYKIDKGETVKRGTSSAGGDVTYGSMESTELDALAQGDKLILRVHPDNRYADSLTETFSLTGSSAAISKFRACLSN